jgi:hypothetical protein
MATATIQDMSEATCVGEAGYGAALTYSRKYEILALDEEKRQVKIKSDNGRVRWFPMGWFDLTGAEVAVLVSITIWDNLEPEANGWVEVELALSDGQKRWCWFVTPNLLLKAGDSVEGTNIQALYGVPHLIVVNEVTAEIISQVLHHIEKRGELLKCTELFSSVESLELILDEPASL